MPARESLRKALGRILRIMRPMHGPKRRWLHCAPYAFVFVGSQAMALDPQTDAISITTTSVQESKDPFAAKERAAPDPQQNNGMAPPADPQDPFAADTSAPVKESLPSRFTVQPLSVLYQGTYIPNVINDQDRDYMLHSLFLDGTANLAVTGSTMMKARVLFEGDVQETQSDVSHRGDISGLEYFFEQRFDGQSQSLTVGRKYLGWSSGFQWRPADLIQNGFTTKNVEIENPNRYLGVDQVRYEINRAGVNIDAVVSNRDRSFYDGLQSAVKVGLSGAAGVSLIYSRNGDYSRKYGLILDTVLPWSTTLALEAVHIDVDRNLMYDTRHFGNTLESLTGVSSFQNIYLSFVKFIDDKRRVDLEFLYDGNGFKDASALVQGAATATQAGIANGIKVDTSLFADQYIGRYYGFTAYTGYVDGWKLQWKPSVLINFGDHSYIGSIAIEREFFRSSNLILALSSYHGGAGTEFGSISHGLGVSLSYVVPIF